MKRTLLCFAAVCLVLAICTPSFAVGDYRWRLTENQSKSVVETGNIFWANLYGAGQNYTGQVLAGALYMTVEEFNTANSANSGYKNAPYQTYTYCVDGQILNNPEWFEKAVGGPPPNNNPSQDPAKWSRIVYLNQQHYFEALTDKAKAAGLQLAYWEIVNDYSSSAGWANLSAGNFSASGFSSQAVNYANTWLSSVGTADYSGQVYYWDGQNQIDRPDVPEMPVMALAPMGMVLLAGIRRRLRI